MPPETRVLSYECIERFEAWVKAHCPCAFDDPAREFYRGLLLICEEEVTRALGQERARVGERLRTPGHQ